jgi:hypothetical protein
MTNDYALYGDGDLGAIMDLDFRGNVSEQGGRIYISDRGAGGTLNISDNLLEGQNNTVHINAGLCNSTIERNYFESNSGDIVRFSATHGGSSLTLGPNYYTACSGAKVEVSNLQFINHDDLNMNKIYLSGNFMVRHSIPNQNEFYLAAADQSAFSNQLDIGVISGRTSIPAKLAGCTIPVSANGSLVSTPTGLRGYEEVIGNGPLHTISGNLAVGDYVVVSAFVKNVDASYVDVILYDNSNRHINESGTALVPFIGETGQWVLVHAAIRATAISTGNFKLRFATGPTKIMHVADFYVYTALTPGLADPLYAFLPALERAGVTTFAENETSVIVIHGMGYAPYNIQVTPGGNIGNMWVDNIDSAQFTIHCSLSSHASTSVYWKSN